MNELSTLTARIDTLAIGLRDTAKAWQERFGLIEREITQQHIWQREHQIETERAQKKRAISTRVAIALIALAGTVANGTLQVIGSSNRSSLRAEITEDLQHKNAELIEQAAKKAVEASDRRYELLVKAAK